MVIDAKEKTALATSVGADERQSFQTKSNSSIPTSNTEINYPDENSSENLEDLFRQMQRMASPYYLHTVSMTELYQTTVEQTADHRRFALRGGVYFGRSAEDR